MKFINPLFSVIMMFVLNIKVAYSGEWKSKHHSININFNKKIWTIAGQQDSAEDSFLTLFDKSDGSSFVIRVEELEEPMEIDNDAIEMTLAYDLRKSDPHLQITDHGYMSMDGRQLKTVDYQYYNKKYGRQKIRHAYVKFESNILMLMFSWPKEHELDEKYLLPPKLAYFIKNINF